MPKIYVKPLSNNQAWKGRKFKTDNYKKYEETVKLLLRKIKLPKLGNQQHFWVYYKFGTSALQDYDNAIKAWQDLLCKALDSDDRYILGALIEKEVVKKGKEFIEFRIFKSQKRFLTFLRDQEKRLLCH